MPDFLPKKYKIRKSTTKGGHSISVPPAWVEHRKDISGNPEEDVNILYDSIIVIIPPGIKVNKKVLAAAVEEEDDSKESK